jgi:hypothetical protein
MSETARELVDQMVAAGEWPEPALLQAIIDKGEEAIAPLLDVIRQHAHGWPEEAPLDHALGLLTHLPRSDAVLPVVLELFRHYDDETLESLPDVLVPYGQVVVEPLLEVIRDRSLDWYSVAVASGIALHVTFDDAEAFARVKAVLREELAKLLSHGEEVNENEYMIASSLVSALAKAADPEGRPLVEAAIDAGLSEMLDKRDVERDYRQGPRVVQTLTANWLKTYRKQREDHLRWETERAAPRPRPAPPSNLPPRSPAKPRPEPVFPVEAPASAPERKIGRNDPCWCGSGKKYKNCHLHTDRE